jgi:hypothetical protein
MDYQRDKFWIKTKKDVESIGTSHFAALEFTTISTPGYDAGDPPDSANVANYIAFADKAAMEKWVKEQEMPMFGSPKRNYIILESKILPIKLELKVTV